MERDPSNRKHRSGRSLCRPSDGHSSPSTTFDDTLDADADTAPDDCDACPGGTATRDADGNAMVDFADFTQLSDCLTGPGAALGPACDCFDFDADTDNDLLDFAEFQILFGS